MHFDMSVIGNPPGYPKTTPEATDANHAGEHPNNSRTDWRQRARIHVRAK